MKTKIAYGLLIIATIGFIGQSLSFHIWLWPSELLISITPQIVIALGILLITSVSYLLLQARASLRRLKVSIFALAVPLATISGGYSLLYSLTAQAPIKLVHTDKASTVRFATFNKLHSNDNYQGIANYIQQQDLDIVALQEVKPYELATLSKLTGYAHSYNAPNLHTTYGSTVGILSRLPISSTHSNKLGGGYAALKAEIDIQNKGLVAFYSFHITPPFTPALYSQSQQHLTQFADIIADEKLPVIAGGDFNTTIFSPKLGQFNTTTQRAVKSITTERWPECSWYGFSPLLCMRIDHIYVPTTATLHKTTIGPDLGSDHRMIISELSL